MADGNDRQKKMFFCKVDKYSLAEKQAFGEFVARCKHEYDDEVEALKGKTRYDEKRKRHVQQIPKQGFLARALRTYYVNLANLKNSDPAFTKALKFAKRCYDKYYASDELATKPPAKRFRQSGAGRKTKAPEVRQALFEWFIDVRGVLKGRLPVKLFRLQAQSLYDEWLKQEPESIPEEEKLMFSKKWIKGWMEEYNVSLRKPNKRFAIGKEARLERLMDYLKNIWTVRKYFIDTHGVDPPIINGDQMPLHRNESSSQNTLSFKSESTYVKENYMLSRERITCFTQLSSDPKISLLPEFVFKGKGTRTHLEAPDGVHFQWAPKGSYRLEQMVQTISNLPNRYNMFTQRDFAIYVLDDYSVHLMPEVRDALFKKGYILVVIGGGITGDIQINDTHCHSRLKSNYRDEEMKLMLDKLKEDPSKIPSPSRDQMMTMLVKSWNQLDIDNSAAFKSLFVTSALDGSEDYLVSDKLYSLIGPEMVQFRSTLMKGKPEKSLREVIRKLIPPKGVKRSSRIEGSELMDCDGDEVNVIELEDDISDDTDSEEAETQTSSHSTVPLPENMPSSSANEVSLSRLSNDPEVNADSEFLDKFHDIFVNHNTSKLFTPYVFQFKSTYEKARRSLKRRLEISKRLAINVQEEDTAGIDKENEEVSTIDVPEEEIVEFDMENEEVSTIDVPEEEIVEQKSADPRVGEYWEVRNGVHTMFVTVVGDRPICVCYFEPSDRGNYYRLSETTFEVCLEDFVKKVDEPNIIPVGRNRLFYTFD